jgi:hypothetical protein
MSNENNSKLSKISTNSTEYIFTNKLSKEYNKPFNNPKNIENQTKEREIIFEIYDKLEKKI